MFMAPSSPNVPRESIPLSRVLASSRYPDNLQIDRWMKRWMDEWLILAFHPWKWMGGWIFTFHQYIHLWNKCMDGWMDGWLNLLPHWTAGTILSFRSGLWECSRAGGVSERIIRLFCQCHHWKHPEGRGELQSILSPNHDASSCSLFYFFWEKKNNNTVTLISISRSCHVCVKGRVWKGSEVWGVWREGLGLPTDS